METELPKPEPDPIHETLTAMRSAEARYNLLERKAARGGAVTEEVLLAARDEMQARTKEFGDLMEKVSGVSIRENIKKFTQENSRNMQ